MSAHLTNEEMERREAEVRRELAGDATADWRIARWVREAHDEVRRVREALEGKRGRSCPTQEAQRDLHMETMLSVSLPLIDARGVIARLRDLRERADTERERCAQMAEAWGAEEDGNGNADACRALRDFANAIRKAGRQP